MKKPYQIPSQRAVRRLEEMAADGNPALQMVLPMAEMVGGLHKGVGEPVRQVDQSYRHPPGACIYESNFLMDSLRGNALGLLDKSSKLSATRVSTPGIDAIGESRQSAHALQQAKRIRVRPYVSRCSECGSERKLFALERDFC